MEISPDSTPTSEPSYASPSAIVNNSNIADDPTVTATSPNGHVPSKHHNNQSSTMISAARLQLCNTKQNSTVASSSSPSTHHNYHSSHHHRHRSVSPLNDAINDTNNSNSIRNSPTYGGNNNVAASNNHLIGDGPPTPEMDLNSAADHRRSKMTMFASQFTDSTPNTLNLSVDGSSGGVSSLQSVMSAASQVSNRLNLLTPSLAKFFRVDLLNHVTNWPSELLEKQVRNNVQCQVNFVIDDFDLQAQKCAEDVYLLGDLECSRISAEIQCARSIVRVAEIAATIQGQR